MSASLPRESPGCSPPKRPATIRTAATYSLRPSVAESGCSAWKKTDTHSPPKQRVNVPLAHFPGFWATFSCEEGAAMHPKDVCEVW